MIEESWLEFVLVSQCGDVVKTQLSSCTYVCFESDGSVVWTRDSREASVSDPITEVVSKIRNRILFYFFVVG